MTTTLKHIKFDEEDLQAVEQVQRLYGCENFSQAVRLAARLAARHARTEVALPSLSKYTTVRKPQSVLEIIQLPPEIDPDEMDKAISAAAQRAQTETMAEWIDELNNNFQIPSTDSTLSSSTRP